MRTARKFAFLKTPRCLRTGLPPALRPSSLPLFSFFCRSAPRIFSARNTIFTSVQFTPAVCLPACAPQPRTPATTFGFGFSLPGSMPAHGFFTTYLSRCLYDDFHLLPVLPFYRILRSFPTYLHMRFILHCCGCFFLHTCSLVTCMRSGFWRLFYVRLISTAHTFWPATPYYTAYHLFLAHMHFTFLPVRCSFTCWFYHHYYYYYCPLHLHTHLPAATTYLLASLTRTHHHHFHAFYLLYHHRNAWMFVCALRFIPLFYLLHRLSLLWFTVPTHLPPAFLPFSLPPRTAFFLPVACARLHLYTTTYRYTAFRCWVAPHCVCSGTCWILQCHTLFACLPPTTCSCRTHAFCPRFCGSFVSAHRFLPPRTAGRFIACSLLVHYLRYSLPMPHTVVSATSLVSLTHFAVYAMVHLYHYTVPARYVPRVCTFAHTAPRSCLCCRHHHAHHHHLPPGSTCLPAATRSPRFIPHLLVSPPTALRFRFTPHLPPAGPFHRTHALQPPLVTACRTCSCLQLRSSTPARSATWTLHLPAVSFCVSAPAACTTTLYHQFYIACLPLLPTVLFSLLYRHGSCSGLFVPFSVSVLHHHHHTAAATTYQHAL